MNIAHIQKNPIHLLVLVNIVTSSLTLIAATIAGAPFSLWFNDTFYILLAVTCLLLVLGIVWDGSIVLFGLLCESPMLRKIQVLSLYSASSLRDKRFFTCGIEPAILIVLTVYAIVGTSNITLINLQLLGHVTQWHDATMWMLEGHLIEWITSLPIPVNFFDALYYSCWINELLAIFFLIVLGRDSKSIQKYCISLILLFYIGRFIGIFNPVMGPAFYHPELFSYLDGSFTQKAMHYLSNVMALTAHNSIDQGGILLGGISALPSLHVGMVFITSYWLMDANRKTLIVTIPWFFLVWISTVVLGWHYVLDGLGGIALGIACIFLARYLCNENHTSVCDRRYNKVTHASSNH